MSLTRVSRCRFGCVVGFFMAFHESFFSTVFGALQWGACLPVLFPEDPDLRATLDAAPPLAAVRALGAVRGDAHLHGGALQRRELRRDLRLERRQRQVATRAPGRAIQLAHLPKPIVIH